MRNKSSRHLRSDSSIKIRRSAVRMGVRSISVTKHAESRTARELKDTILIQRNMTAKERTRFIEQEGYDPKFMYKALKETPIPSAAVWDARVSRANQVVEDATNASFLDKFRTTV